MKNKIRLTESGLRKIIKKYLNEAFSYEELKDKYDFVLFDEPLEHYCVVTITIGSYFKGTTFAIDANDEETALEKVVAFIQNNDLLALTVPQEEAEKWAKEELENKGIDATEYIKQHDNYDDIYEKLNLYYVDPTMEGGKEPCFLELDYLNIEFI